MKRLTGLAPVVLLTLVPMPARAQVPATAADSGRLAAAVAQWLGARTTSDRTRGPYVVRGDGQSLDGTRWAERVVQALRDSQPELLAASPVRETLRVMFGPVRVSGDTVTFRIAFNRCRGTEGIVYSGTSAEYAFRPDGLRWVWVRPDRMTMSVGDGFTCPW